MGRVKRYKKLKACDPCAPKRKPEGEDKYDLPPVDSDDEGASCVVRRAHVVRCALCFCWCWVALASGWGE